MVLALPLGILSTVHRQGVRELHQLRGRQVATGHDERAPHPALNGAAEMGRAWRSTVQVTKLGAILRWRAGRAGRDRAIWRRHWRTVPTAPAVRPVDRDAPRSGCCARPALIPASRSCEARPVRSPTAAPSGTSFAASARTGRVGAGCRPVPCRTAAAPRPA